MSHDVRQHLDGGKSTQLQNFVVQPLPSAPGSPVAGLFYFDQTLATFRIYSGSAWVDIPATPAVLQALYDAQTIVAAVTDNTPAAVTIPTEGTIGRTASVNSGNVGALTWAQVRAALGALNNFTPPTGAISMGTQVVSNVAAPVVATDAANKGYVDATATGLDFKDAVRVASTANVTVSSAPSTIDGVTLSSGDRILLKNQTAGAENGIYTFASAGAALTRATDADTSSEVTSGMYVVVTAGTANANTAWVLSTSGSITLGTTALTFTLFSSGAGSSVTGTTNRITVTSGQVDIASTYAGQATITTLGTITTGVWNGSNIPVANGGTGSSNAAGAKTALGFMTRATATLGNGSSTSLTFAHGLGQDAIIQVRDATTNSVVDCEIVMADATNATLIFAVAPATNGIKAVAIG